MRVTTCMVTSVEIESQFSHWSADTNQISKDLAVFISRHCQIVYQGITLFERLVQWYTQSAHRFSQVTGN